MYHSPSSFFPHSLWQYYQFTSPIWLHGFIFISICIYPYLPFTLTSVPIFLTFFIFPSFIIFSHIPHTFHSLALLVCCAFLYVSSQCTPPLGGPYYVFFKCFSLNAVFFSYFLCSISSHSFILISCPFSIFFSSFFSFSFFPFFVFFLIWPNPYLPGCLTVLIFSRIYSNILLVTPTDFAFWNLLTSWTIVYSVEGLMITYSVGYSPSSAAWLWHRLRYTWTPLLRRFLFSCIYSLFYYIFTFYILFFIIIHLVFDHYYSSMN